MGGIGGGLGLKVESFLQHIARFALERGREKQRNDVV